MSMPPFVINNYCMEYMDLWSLEMVYVIQDRGLGISAIFVVVACIGYTINVMA